MTGLVMSKHGKQVYDKLYSHVCGLDQMPEETKALISEAIRLGGTSSVNQDFNVVRVRADHNEVALLDYPRFFEDAFPILARSWRVHVPGGLIGFRDYRQSLNPPVLHRKELLLPGDHPDRSAFAEITILAESIGLFDDPVRIGYLKSWTTFIERKGYRVHGSNLVPVGNDQAITVPESECEAVEVRGVQRHLTALSRTTLSAPLQSLLRHGLLRDGAAFLDYGCGRGDDLAGLQGIGIDGHGWDPHYRPDGLLVESDVVNLGFVINVIEDFDERIEALSNAYRLARRVLAVSTMLQSEGHSGRTFRDGVLTGRNTFQKYYSQAELQQFIESVLDETATPVAPGIFYVFKDRSLERQFYTDRMGSRSRAARAALPTLSVYRYPSKSRSPPTTRTEPPEDPERAVVLARLWQRCLGLGRLAEPDEVDDGESLRSTFGSFPRALKECIRRNDQTALERSGAGRRDDLAVFFALQLFSRRRRFRELDIQLQRDVKALFGSFANVEAHARQLLFTIRDVDQISRACEDAAQLGLGWLEPGHALHLHTSLVDRLSALLRVYVGCATAMYGDITVMDLVKLHIGSGKVTLMRFDDFGGKPLPAMQERVKVRLRDQAIDVFTYGEGFEAPLLYRKSRFINEEFPYYAEQKAFDEALDELSLFDFSGYGPKAADFWRVLGRSRWVINGFTLERTEQLPSIDDRCSEHFTFRQLIECGDTFKRSSVANVPREHETYAALADLANLILEPVVEYFGAIELTYGFCSRLLAKAVVEQCGGIAPRLDQHASHETNSRGDPICSRLGAAVDFLVVDEDMAEVANWLIDHTPFDRLYFYGTTRPLHVSYGPENSRTRYLIAEVGRRRIPRQTDRF